MQRDLHVACGVTTLNMQQIFAIKGGNKKKHVTEIKLFLGDISYSNSGDFYLPTSDYAVGIFKKIPKKIYIFKKKEQFSIKFFLLLQKQ